MAQLYLKSGGSWIDNGTIKDVYIKQNGQWIKTDFSQINGNYIYENLDGKITFNYVSLGDSIAAGHLIDDNWDKNYGTGSQFGENGNTQTAIVPGCYTDLAAKELRSIYGSGNVSVKSFAHSGDRIEQLMAKLSQPNVIDAIQKAHIVSVCIGANDVLEPAMSNLEQYITMGDSALNEISATVSANLTRLADDSYQYSFTALLNRLYALNPNASYVFTTIYNPYKYLWLEDGDQGFFKPMLDVIPAWTIDVDQYIEDTFGFNMSYPTLDGWSIVWHDIELNYNITEAIKSGLLNTPIVRTLFSRVNGLCDYSENLVNRLNEVITSKINAFNKPNFSCRSTKAVFDTYPDRNVPAHTHYNDLVNVEFTRGYTTMTMDWQALWKDKYGDNYGAYWYDLAMKYLSFRTDAFPSMNVFDYVSFDINGYATDLVYQTIEKVIVPNVDPHPEITGHEVICSQQPYTT